MLLTLTFLYLSIGLCSSLAASAPDQLVAIVTFSSNLSPSLAVLAAVRALIVGISF